MPICVLNGYDYLFEYKDMTQSQKLVKSIGNKLRNY